MPEPYKRQAHYSETDQMGIIHHSNYIRWLEEARIDFLDQIGLNYDKLEKERILCPVLSVSCQYRSPVKFHDTVLIFPSVLRFNGIRLSFSYEINDFSSNERRIDAETSHCFVDQNFHVMNMKKEKTFLYKRLLEFL